MVFDVVDSSGKEWGDSVSSCEKCWRDSGGNSEDYEQLLEERKDRPCSPEDQAGQWWDSILMIDIRHVNKLTSK